jgi:hypothetical protein
MLAEINLERKNGGPVVSEFRDIWEGIGLGMGSSDASDLETQRVRKILRAGALFALLRSPYQIAYHFLRLGKFEIPTTGICV